MGWQEFISWEIFREDFKLVLFILAVVMAGAGVLAVQP